MTAAQADNRIRRVRVSKGLTLKGLADRCETHFTTIGKLERGQMELTLTWMRKLAAALDVRVIDLIEETE